MSRKIILVLFIFTVLLSSCSQSDDVIVSNTIIDADTTNQDIVAVAPTIPAITSAPTATPTAASITEETYLPTEGYEMLTPSYIDISFSSLYNDKIVVYFETQYNCANVYINKILVCENFKTDYEDNRRKIIAEIMPECFIEDELVEVIIEIFDENGEIVEIYEIKNLYYTRAEDSLENICENEDIEYLLIDNREIVGDIYHLVNLENLKYMHINYGEYLFGNIKYLNRLDYLEVVSLHSYNIFGDIEELSQMYNLRMLDLDDCRSLQGDLSSFKDLVNLEHISIDECFGVNGDLSFMKDLIKLKYIELSAGTITGATNDMAHLVNLEYIDLWCCGEVTGDVSALSNLVNLRVCCFDGCIGITGSCTLPSGYVIEPYYG